MTCGFRQRQRSFGDIKKGGPSPRAAPRTHREGDQAVQTINGVMALFVPAGLRLFPDQDR
jgi:hypothetical protein